MQRVVEEMPELKQEEWKWRKFLKLSKKRIRFRVPLNWTELGRFTKCFKTRKNLLEQSLFRVNHKDSTIKSLTDDKNQPLPV